MKGLIRIALFLMLFTTMIFGEGDFSVDFSTGRYVRIPTSSSLSGLNEFTIECWYFQTGFDGGDERIVGHEAANATDGLYQISTTGSYSSAISDGSTVLAGSYLGTVTQNAWTHLASSYDGTTFRFFIDGVLAYSQTGDIGPIGITTENIVINRHTWSGESASSRLSGQIDELRISNSARYTAPFTVSSNEFDNDANTMGLWHFNEGVGDSASDASGNGNTAFYENGTGWSNNTPGLSPPLNHNIVLNPSFEDGLDNWNPYQNLPGWDTSKVEPHSGSSALVFNFPSGSGYYDAGIKQEGDHLYIEAGIPYYFSYWRRDIFTHDTHTAGETILDTDIRIGGTNYTHPMPDMSPSDEWKHIDTTIIFPVSGNAIIDFQIHGYATSNSAIFALDDIILEPVQSTTPIPTWKVQVRATQASLNDVDNYLGVAKGATNTFDNSFDEVEPPAAPGSSISLYFPHPEWSHALGDDFSSDIRSETDLSDTMQVWDFEVVSTDTGNVSLTFQYTAIPDVPVILENEDTGERVFLVHNESYDFAAEANITYFFKVSIGDTTAPQVNAGRSFSGPRILRAGHQHDLDFQATDGFMVDQIDLLFSSDSGGSFVPFATMGDTTAHSWIIPNTFANVLYGAALQVKAMDYAGNFSTMASDYVLTIASDSLYSSVYNGWNLWGAPITPLVDTMEVNLDDDFSGYWTTYDYVDNGYTYDGFLTKGAGYWLGTLEDAEIDVIGAPSTSDEDAPLDIGWNLLSNPLVLDVSLDSMTVINGNTNETLFYPDAVNAGWVNSIYEYDGNGYVQPTVIQPWKGYWFSALLENLTVIFPIHKHGEPILARDTREEGWGLLLSASTSSGAEDNLLAVGAHPEATDMFDNGFDEVRPPTVPGNQYVQLDLLHPEWDFPLGDAFVRDIRAENLNDSNEVWIVNVTSSEDEVILGWEVFQLPDNFDVGIDLDGDGLFENLLVYETITVATGSQFTLLAGANALATVPMAIPTEFAMHQNYPNPFNPTTTIAYDLPELSDVKITVYDITGREVIQLVNSVQKPAGYHDIIWTGMDAGYNQVSTGLYFTRIEAGDFSKTIKMLFLK